jgi:hypothetical protein
MLNPNFPYFLWRVGSKYQRLKSKFKKLVFKISNTKILIKNNQSYVDFEEWFMSDREWQRYFKSLLLEQEVLYKKYLKKKYVAILLKESIQGGKNNSTKLLYIATFEIFLRLFFNEGIKKVN